MTVTVTERTAVAKTAAAEAKVILKIKEMRLVYGEPIFDDVFGNAHITHHNIRINDSTLKNIYIGDEIDGC